MTTLLMLSLFAAPVPPPKLDGVPAHHMTGEYRDVTSPEAYTCRRFVLSSDGSFWSHWNGTEYAGTWSHCPRTGDVLIWERPAHNPAVPYYGWTLNGVTRRRGMIGTGRYQKVR